MLEKKHEDLSANTIKNLLLFIINPFLGYLFAIWNIRKNRNGIFILFSWFLLFGLSFCAVNETADSFRYLQDFEIEKNYTFSKLYTIISEYFTFEGNKKDIYTTILNVVIGSFTNNYHFLFFSYAIVFGLFSILSLNYLLKYKVDDTYIFFCLLFLFYFSNPIFNINGVRFWTATWIAVYSTFKIVMDNKLRFWFILLLLPLIHGSFVLWIVFLLIAVSSWIFQKTWIVLFFLSFIFSATSYIHLLNAISPYLPNYIQNLIWAYTESDMAISRMSGNTGIATYAMFLNSLPKLFINLMMVILILNRKKLSYTVISNKFFGVTLILLTITDFLSSIPSMHRFLHIVIPLIATFWAMNYINLKKYNLIFYALPIIYAYQLLYYYRNVSSVTEMELYVLPLPLTIINYLFSL